MSSNVWPSNRDPYHGDIVQGRLGNCFLIASLQALASCQPQWLKSIISVSPLSCFFYQQGERVEIPMVMEPMTNDYQYCRSTVADIQWPYIIEQAYAQFYGGRFENLAGGNTSEALYDLLGKPVEEFEPNDKEVWETLEKGLAERSVLATCGTVTTNGATIANTSNGLLINHAYVVLATFVYQQTREKYVLIHNPHGVNSLHKENSRARAAFFNLTSKSHTLWSNTPGTQLLSWSELKRTCNRIQICHLNVEPRQVLYADWSLMTSGGCSNFSTFYRNPYLLLPHSYSNKTVLVLGHTIDQRHERTEASAKLSYAQLGIAIIQLKTHTLPIHDNYEMIYQSKFWNKREVALTIDFEAKQGKQYAAVLSTYHPNIISSFWLEVFSRQSLPAVEIRTWTNIFQQTVQTIRGTWHRDNAGGRQNKSDTSIFYKNPAYLLTLSDASAVRLILHQSFSTSLPLAKYHPIGIYVYSASKNEEPTFIRARSISRSVHLNAGEEYYIVPTCYEANSFGDFELNVLCDVPFTLDSTERKLTPLSPPDENETSEPTTNPATIVSSIRRPMASTTTAKTVGIKQVPKKQNVSVTRTRLSTLIDEYSKRK